MTDDELARLQALADAATAGPWTAATTVDEYGQRLHTMDVLPLTSFGEIEPHDAAFIAASRDAIPALIAEVRRLRSAMRETFVQGAIYERARTTACGQQPANGYLANLARCEAFRRWPDGEVNHD